MALADSFDIPRFKEATISVARASDGISPETICIMPMGQEFYARCLIRKKEERVSLLCNGVSTRRPVPIDAVALSIEYEA